MEADQKKKKKEKNSAEHDHEHSQGEEEGEAISATCCFPLLQHKVHPRHNKAT